MHDDLLDGEAHSEIELCCLYVLERCAVYREVG